MAETIIMQVTFAEDQGRTIRMAHLRSPEDWRPGRKRVAHAIRLLNLDLLRTRIFAGRRGARRLQSRSPE
jgi:hypothetical protein